MSRKVPKALRELVRRRANFRCEYCLLPEAEAGYAHQPDHIRSRKHAGISTADNLAWACLLCNLAKSAETAAVDDETGEAARLFNPRRDSWANHFRVESGMIVGLTAEGRVTVRTLQLNQTRKVLQRRLLIAQGRY